MSTLTNKLLFSFTIASPAASRILTGIQPTGNLTIGNYLGSVQNLLDIQKTHAKDQTLVFIADLHSLTTAFDQDHAQIKHNTNIGKNTRQIAKILISSGVCKNPTNVLFVQSAVKQHAELCWMLGCLGPQHWLNNMIQYKQKSSKNSSLGIYSYPVLMAADILLYKAVQVPVGEDQKQHLELAKRYAERFNSIVGHQFFPSPKYIVAKAPRVMSLTDPTKKMSKSDSNERSRINIYDSKDEIALKIKRAVTDSQGNFISYDPENRKGLANLLKIYSCFKEIDVETATLEFQGRGIKQFKESLVEIVSNKLGQIQFNMNNISDQELTETLDQGARKARQIASGTVSEVKSLLGLFK